ncbi:cell division protein ZapB, partial [Mannheimia haemolytica]
MSLSVLDQLEEKIKQAVETIQLLQLEVEELKGKTMQRNKKTTPCAANMN